MHTPRSTAFRAVGLSVVVAAGMMVGAAQASQLYGAGYGNDRFNGLDTASGLATLIGNSGNSNVGDLTSDTRTPGGPVWGVDISTANALVTFDTATGNILSTLGITGVTGRITSIAFDPVTGTMFGNETAGFGGGDGLYSIDTGTGIGSFIGNIGFANVFAMGFSQTGQLYGIDAASNNLLAIDTASGAGTAIGSTGLGFSFDMASDPITDIMYLVDSGREALFTIDTSTAAVTLVGPWGPAGQNIAGLAFVAPVPIPGALPLLLGGLGALHLLRRRRAA